MILNFILLGLDYMNISCVSKNNNNSLFCSVKRRIFGLIPNFSPIDNPEKCNRFGTIINRPHINRGIMGATALLSQPFIDYFNPKVDEETAAVSTCRTIGKVVAGTSVGMGVRWLCYRGIDFLTSEDKDAPKWKRRLMPSQNIEKSISKKNIDWFKNYKSTLATIAGLSVMLLTNVALDVPFTNWISSKLIKARCDLNEKNTSAYNSAKRGAP